MVWEIANFPYKFLRLLRRHMFYIVGATAWVIILGALTVSMLQWRSGSQPPAKKAAPGGTISQPTTPSPEVAGANTTTPDPETPPDATTTEPEDSLQGPLHILPATTTPPIIPSAPVEPSQPTTPEQPVVVPPPEPETPQPPTPTPEPVPNTPTANPACVVASLPGLALSGKTSLTVPVGGQTALEVISTSDTSNVLWSPMEPVIWADGSTDKPLSPVSMILSYPPGTVIGSTAAYYVRALATAVPGTVVEVSWHIEDGARGVCQNMSIQVTVVAPVPPPAV